MDLSYLVNINGHFRSHELLKTDLENKISLYNLQLDYLRLDETRNNTFLKSIKDLEKTLLEIRFLENYLGINSDNQIQL